MTRTTAKPLLTRRFTKAVKLAQRLHRCDLRKCTQIPYLAHLLSVSALVLEHGGTEDQAIAALLHDAAEDHGGQKRINKLRSKFGDDVADIVAACSDSLTEDPKGKAEWWPRKVAYLDHLTDDVLTLALPVSVADKLHNARAILADYRNLGDELWCRFNKAAGRSGNLWYYTKLVEIYSGKVQDRAPAAMVDELRRNVDAICEHATSLGHDVESELHEGRRREFEARVKIG